MTCVSEVASLEMKRKVETYVEERVACEQSAQVIDDVISPTQHGLMRLHAPNGHV
jgi:hypothetical protein